MRLLVAWPVLAGSLLGLVTAAAQVPAGALPAPILESPWADLAGADAARAYEAVRLLIRSPDQAVPPFLKGKLRPVAPADPAQVSRPIEDLRSKRFTVRERANAELERLGEQAEAELRKVYAANPPLEVRRRVEQLLQKLQGPIVLPELLRAWRAVEVLEHLGTPAAREVLHALASGAPVARLTREARASLDRLDRRLTAPFRPAFAPRPATDLYGDPLPAGAVARLGTVRFRHPGGGLHVLFAPDGKTVMSTANETSLRVWDAANGKLLRGIDGADSLFVAVALSPDGKLLATAGVTGLGQGGGSVIKLWDTATLKERRTIAPLERFPVALAFLPDGKTLVSTGKREGKIWLWDVSSGRQVRAFKAVSGGPTLAVSPDGALVATTPGGGDRGVRLWDVKTGREVRKLKGRDRDATVVAFAPDGKTLATGGNDLFGVRLWDAATGRLVRSLAADDGTNFTHAVTFSPDGRLVASIYGRERGILLWEVASGKLLRRLPVADGAYGLAFSPDARILGVATGYGLRLWRVDTLEEVAGRAEGHRGLVHRILFTPDGKRVVTASDDETVRVWDAVGGKPLHVLGHQSWVRGLALSPDGRLIASSSLDDTVRLWETATGREVYRLAGHGRLGSRRALAFSGDGKDLISWGDDMYLRTWDIARGKALREHRVRPTGFAVREEGEEPNAMEELQNRGEGLHDGAFAADARALFLQVGAKLHVIHVRTGKELRAVPAPGGESLHVAPAGNLLLTTNWSQPGSLRLHRVPSGEHRQTIAPVGGQSGYAAFTADGKMFAVASGAPERRIDLWETATGRKRWTIPNLPAVPDALAFSPDGRFLAAGLEDTSVLIWDLLAEDTTRER